LTTRATADGSGGFVVNGSKIWTSWAKWARWCLALVRTGTTEERHRGLTMVVIDLRQAGVEVSPIRQANGTDELAQVFLDDVAVPSSGVVGEVGQGWEVAMYLLARERGTMAWLRHCGFRNRLIETAPSLGPEDDRVVGDFVAQWAGLRAVAAELLRRESAGERLGPESAFNKLLMTRAEQGLFNLVQDATGAQVALPLDDADEHLQNEFLFSRIVTVYGGSQQMQLITIAKHVLQVGRG
jgi:alkylation response protein AidB-like acyl-CoA dehydrogenase